MYLPATTLEQNPPQSVVVYSRRLFTETIDKLIPSGLKDIWNDKQFYVQTVPDSGFASTLELYGGEAGVTRVTIDEYTDFRDIKSLALDDITEDIKALALLAAESYVSNVKNAFIKGGRLTKYSKTKLCFTDWKARHPTGANFLEQEIGLSNRLFSNRASTTLAAGITSSATSLSVTSGGGSLFPSLAAGARPAPPAQARLRRRPRLPAARARPAGQRAPRRRPRTQAAPPRP